MFHIKLMDVKKLMETNILASKELSKMDQCLYKLLLFVARKNQDLLKIKELLG